jgi:DNA-binding MarR family transcriptional regulator
MSKATERREKQTKLLSELYRESGGDTLAFVNVYTAAEQVGIARDDVDDVVDRLVEDYFIKRMEMGGGVVITSAGVEEAEQHVLSQGEREQIERTTMAFLKAIYDAAGASTSCIVDSHDAAEKAGVELAKADLLFERLKDRGYAERKTGMGGVSITRAGVDAVEEAEDEE